MLRVLLARLQNLGGPDRGVAEEGRAVRRWQRAARWERDRGGQPNGVQLLRAGVIEESSAH